MHRPWGKEDCHSPQPSGSSVFYLLTRSTSKYLCFATNLKSLFLGKNLSYMLQRNPFSRLNSNWVLQMRSQKLPILPTYKLTCDPHNPLPPLQNWSLHLRAIFHLCLHIQQSSQRLSWLIISLLDPPFPFTYFF